MDIKFCGVRTGQDAIFCNILKPDYMGIILSPGFRRTITPEQAASVVRYLSPSVRSVGVFVNASTAEILRTLQIVPLHVIQLHGQESASQIAQLQTETHLPVWKAVRVRNTDDIRRAETLGANRLILEGYVSKQIGGTGIKADWNTIAQASPKQPYFLAGGLTPDNLRTAMKIVTPYGVDLSSGTETGGVKDFRKMQEIIRIVRGELTWKK